LSLVVAEVTVLETLCLQVPEAHSLLLLVKTVRQKLAAVDPRKQAELEDWPMVLVPPAQPEHYLSEETVARAIFTAAAVEAGATTAAAAVVPIATVAA
jgi:hypothetical protein